MAKNTSANEISANIRKYRKMNNLTQQQMADLLFLDMHYYAQLERGERVFSVEKIIRACQVLHVGIDKIIEIKDENSSDKDDLLESISADLKPLSHSKLLVIRKFIDEIVPYMN